MDFETLPATAGAGRAITSPGLKTRGFTPPEPTLFREPWIAAIAQLQAACGVEGQAENTLNKVLAKVKKCQSESTQN